MAGGLDVPDPLSHLENMTPPPLKGSKGHLGQIQCAHMAGGLECAKVLEMCIHFVPMQKQNTKGGWTSHCSCPSTASGFFCGWVKLHRFCIFPVAILGPQISAWLGAFSEFSVQI